MSVESFFRLLAWRNVFKLMMAPAAVLVPISTCATAATFGVLFGRGGALCGTIGGAALGVVLVAAWYAFVVQGFVDKREEEALERIKDDVLRTNQLGRPRASARPQDVAPIELGSVGGVDISGDLGAAIGRVRAHASVDFDEALRAAEALRTAHAREPAAIGVCAELLRRQGKNREACVRAGEAIHVGVLRGDFAAAAEVLASFWEERDELVLDASVADALAKHLASQGDEERAAWLARR